MPELARAEVALEVSFEHLDEDIKRGLEQRVRAAAKKAQAELDRTQGSAGELGDALDKKVGGGADKAGAAVRRAAKTASSELGKAARAADGVASAVDRLAAGAGHAQEALFDIDEGGRFVEIKRQVEAVQTALFDIDPSSLKRVEEASDRAATAAHRAGSALAGMGDGDAGRAVGDLAEQVDQLGRSTQRSARSLNDYTVRLGLLASAIAAAATTAPTLVAAGAGLAAAIGLAVPAIAAVIKGTTEMADRWDGLTKRQKIAADQTRFLIDRYKEVARSVEPDALRAYNGAIVETTRLLPRLAPLATTTAKALTAATQSLGQGLDSPRALRFFDFLEANAGPAVAQLTSLLGDLGAAFASTVEALAPLSSTGLGTVSMLLRLLTVLNDLNPAFVQLVTLGVALRAPLTGMSNLLGKASEKATKFAGGAEKAGTATKLLNLAAGVGPNLYVAAGTALAYFAIKALTAKSAIDKTIESVNAQNRAFGNNLRGYEAANKVLASKLVPIQQRLASAMHQLGDQANYANIELAKGALVADDLAGTPLRQAMEANRQAILRINEAAQLMVDSGFAPSVAAARQLANAAGVDLTKALDGAGNLTASAAARIATYVGAVQTAHDPTIVLADAWSRARNEALGLTAQVQALQEVMDHFLNPALAMLDATNRLTEVQQRFAKAAKDGKVTALERSQALSQEIAALRDKLVAEQQVTGATTRTTAETLKLLPALSQLAAGNRAGQAAVYALARSLDGATQGAHGAITVVDALGHRIKVLPSGKVIKLKADPSQAISGARQARSAIQSVHDRTVYLNLIRRDFGIKANTGIPFRASGGPVYGPGTSTSDSILARLSNGEFVVNARQTRRWRALLEAINAGRFASGGLVGSVRRLTSGALAVQPIAGYASGGTVSRTPQVNIGALLGADIRRGLRGSAKAIAKEVARIRKSLEKKILAIGDAVGKDFVKAISTGTASQINTSFRSIENKIRSAFRGIRTNVDNRLINRLDKQNKRLATLATRRDAIAKKIEDATQLAASVTSNARSFADITGFDEKQQAGARTIADTLRDRLAAIRTYQRDIQTLANRGLDKTVIRQLLDAGVDEGGRLARLLATSSRSDLATISALQKQINTATKNLGTDSADLLYDAGVKASRGFLAGLKADQKEIVALMTEIAKSVSKTVKKTLKIKSPSRVLEADGINTMAGYIRGVRRLAARARSAVATAVTQVRAQVPPPPPDPGSGPAPFPSGRSARQTVVYQNNHFHQVAIDPDALLARAEQRLVAALR